VIDQSEHHDLEEQNAKAAQSVAGELFSDSHGSSQDISQRDYKGSLHKEGDSQIGEWGFLDIPETVPLSWAKPSGARLRRRILGSQNSMACWKPLAR
jgi:hypothetical protein